MKIAYLSTLAILALAACGEPPVTDAGAPAETAAAAPDAATPPADPLSQSGEGPVPVEFRGSWAINSADCTNDPGQTRIAVSQNAVAFFEGRSHVVSATVPHEGALALEVDHTAEGQTARETHMLTIDQATGKLAYNRRGADYSYTRCG